MRFYSLFLYFLLLTFYRPQQILHIHIKGFAMATNISKFGCKVLLHHLLTVASEFSHLFCHHLLVRLFSASTNLRRFISCAISKILSQAKVIKIYENRKDYIDLFCFFLKNNDYSCLFLGTSIYFLGYFYVISWV